MQALSSFPLVEPGICKSAILAILSGEMIHIIYPNGKVELMTAENFHQDLNQNKLETCVVWGRFEDF